MVIKVDGLNPVSILEKSMRAIQYALLAIG
jgi:hypothetical protein